MTHDCDVLLDAVVESGLLPAAAVAAYRDWGGDAAALAKQLVRDRLLTPFQARVLLGGPGAPQLPSFFLTERYKVLEHLGAGGMGEVYLAEHLLLRRVVALKVIVRRPRGSSGHGGAVERFFREARVVAQLDHPNVVRVFDMDRTPAGPFLVMEYVDGADLHGLIRRHGRLSVPRAVDAVVQAAKGLGHAHARGLVHRDVKPGNLLLDRQGTVKVVDLGLASFRNVHENEGLTAEYNQDHLIGTADYVSPEQALDGSAADARSDTYSLGATLYFLLTGRPPFSEGTLSQKLLAHQLKAPPPIPELRPDVPADLVAVVDLMMAKRPADRPATMAEVVELLRPFAAEKLPPPEPHEMPKHPPSAYRLGLVGAPPAATTPALASAVTKRETKVAAAARSVVAGPKSVARAAGSLPPRSNPKKALSPDDVFAPVELVEPAPPPPHAPPPPSAVVAPAVTRRATLLMGFAGGLAAVGGGIWYAFAPDTGPRRPRLPVNPPPPPPTSPPPPALTLLGSGSTFIKPAMDLWTEEYQKLTGTKVDYKGIGSGKGIDNMLERVSHFGGTDVPLTDAQLKKAKELSGDVVHVPLALGAVAVTYNLPDVKDPIRFTGPVLADIFLGKIKRWNDDALAFCNPKQKLPDAAIAVVHRGDASGTTGIWTDYLAKVSGEWEAKVGRGTTVRWPVGAEAEKSSGVAGLVTKTVGAIGYVELSYALERNLRVGLVKNKGERYVAPSLEGVTAAAAAELQALPADLRFALTNAAGESSYPVAGCAWAVAYAAQPPAVQAELVKFLRWVATDGQASLPALRYAPLPPAMAARVNERLAAIRPER